LPKGMFFIGRCRAECYVRPLLFRYLASIYNSMHWSVFVSVAINSFYVVLEVIENRLPALSLHIDRIFVFRIECGDHFGGIPFAPKLDVDLTTVRHNVSNVFKRLDGRISAFEIKPKTSIFSFHSVLKLATYTQVVCRTCTMPVV